MHEEIVKRMRIATGSNNDNQLSVKLGLSSNSVIIGWSKRGKVPDRRISQVSSEYGVDKDWLLTGSGSMIQNDPKDTFEVQNIIELQNIIKNTNSSFDFSEINDLISQAKIKIYSAAILEKLNLSTILADLDIETDCEYIQAEEVLGSLRNLFFVAMDQAPVEYFDNANGISEAIADQEKMLSAIVTMIIPGSVLSRMKLLPELIEYMQDYLTTGTEDGDLYVKKNIEDIYKSWCSLKAEKQFSAVDLEDMSIARVPIFYISDEDADSVWKLVTSPQP